MNNKTTFYQKFISSSISNAYALIIIASSFIYLIVFTLPFLLPQLYYTIPPVDYTKLTNYSPIGFFAYLFGLGTLFALFIGAVRLASHLPTANSPWPTIRLVWMGSLIFAVILLFSYPLTAIDLFIYAIRSRGWALYGLPPLSTPPELLPTSDPWLGLAGEWIDATSPYGPLWELIALGAFYLSGGSFLVQIFLLKLVGLLAYLGCIGLIYRTLLLLQPNWAIVGSMAFAWNPLVLFESVQNAHNDIVMMFFFMAAVWVFVRYHSPLPEGEGPGVRVLPSRGIQPSSVGNERLQVSQLLLFCLLMAASVLVKFVTILVAPFFVIALAMRQQRWLERFRVFTLSSAMLLVFIIIPMLFVWPGWEEWAVIQSGSGAGRSLLALFILGLKDVIGTNPAFDLSRNVIVVIFGIIYLYQLWLMLKPRNFDLQPTQSLELPIAATFNTFFWYVLLAAPVFHAWYLLWFLPAAVLLLPRQRPLAAAVVFSITALTVIPYFETVRVWYPFLLRNHFIGHLIGVPLLILPPALTLLWPTRSTAQSRVSSN